MFIEPKVPVHYGEYTIKYRYESSTYVIDVPDAEKSGYKVVSVVLDGKEIKSNTFDLKDDNKRHYVHVKLR